MTTAQQIAAMTEALKPCPFCGGMASLHIGMVAFNDHEIHCDACGFSGPNFGAFDEPNPCNDAMAHWNTRAAPTLQDAARVLLGQLPSEHKCWAAMQDGIDDGLDVGDIMRAALRAIADAK